MNASAQPLENISPPGAGLKTPPLLMCATLLFWGWQTELWTVASIMAVVLESSRLLRTRWEFSQTDFNRVWNLCTVFFVGAAIISLTSKEGTNAVAGIFEATTPAGRSVALTKTTQSVLALFQWLPMVFFPAIAAQVFSQRDKVDFSTFSLILRWRKARNKSTGAKTAAAGGINVSYLYFAICLFGASATNNRALWFYPLLALLLVWGLWSQRTKRCSIAGWCGLVAVVAALGFAGHVGLVHLQKVLENLDSALLTRFSGKNFDPKESRTALGSIGKLKLSGSIVLRLEKNGEPAPALLREASYNLFRSPLWYVTKKNFDSVIPENDGTWNLLPKKHSRKSVTIARYLSKGAGLLALPNGTSQLEDLPIFLVETNSLGVARVQEGPGLVSYKARYDVGATIDSPPDGDDRVIPESERPAIAQIASELGLRPGIDPQQTLKIVAGFFENKFEYSSYLTSEHRATSNQTALAAFLLKKRAGHCEYFATATALLLRKTGIPTRYAAGYSVQEATGRGYVVRERHAHAWCLVYLNGAWQDFDTTPASWNAEEAKHASVWEPLADAWSRLWFEFSKWRWSKTGSRSYVVWLLVPLLALFVGRIFFKKQWKRFRQQRKVAGETFAFPGQDSEFYLIEKRLLEFGLARPASEPLSAWLKRIASAAPAGIDSLVEILPLHYRHRFDPAGLPFNERAILKSEVQAWLEKTSLQKQK